jgi:hypothetical protein
MFIHVESYDVGEHFAVTPAAGCNYWAVTHKKSGRKFPLRNFYHYAENAANVVVELESMDVQWGDISPEDGKKNAELVPREMMEIDTKKKTNGNSALMTNPAESEQILEIYAADPLAFFHDILGCTPWPGQEEIMWCMSFGQAASLIVWKSSVARY